MNIPILVGEFPIKITTKSPWKIPSSFSSDASGRGHDIPLIHFGLTKFEEFEAWEAEMG